MKTGEIEGDSQTVMDKVENSDSYSALLWGTMAASMLTIIFYHLQIVREGEMIIPNASALADLFWKKKDKDEDAHLRAHFLLGMGESVESFLYGMGHIFPALIVLTLAWASG